MFSLFKKTPPPEPVQVVDFHYKRGDIVQLVSGGPAMTVYDMYAWEGQAVYKTCWASDDGMHAAELLHFMMRTA